LEQNEKSCFVEKEKEENVENVVNGIAYTLDLDLNIFDNENAYRKHANRNPDKALIIVKLASRRKK